MQQQPVKPTLTVARMFSKSAWQAVFLRSALTALLLAPLAAPLAALHAGRNLPGVPSFGKLRADSFQALANHGTQTSDAWN